MLDCINNSKQMIKESESEIIEVLANQKVTDTNKKKTVQNRCLNGH